MFLRFTLGLMIVGSIKFVVEVFLDFYLLLLDQSEIFFSEKGGSPASASSDAHNLLLNVQRFKNQSEINTASHN